LYFERAEKGGTLREQTCHRQSSMTLVMILWLFLGGGSPNLMAGPGGGILFGTGASLGHLLNINPATGAGLFIGNIGFQTS